MHLGVVRVASVDCSKRLAVKQKRTSSHDEVLRHDEEANSGDVQGVWLEHVVFDPSVVDQRQQKHRSTPQIAFGIHHYGAPVNYDAHSLINHNIDVLDAQFVGLLRASSDAFVAKLVSGPSIAAECHPIDDDTIVQAQVAVVPLRDPSRLNDAAKANSSFTSFLDPGVAHPLTSR